MPRLPRATLLIALSLLPLTFSLKLGEIFDVYTEDGPGTCKDFYDIRNADSPLELWWSQISTLNAAALKAVNSYEGDNNEETRFVARSMFGIIWGDGGAEPKGSDAEKLEEVRARFQRMHDFITIPRIPPNKPRLFCDSTYRKLQKPDSLVIDLKTGKPLPKDPDRPDGPFETQESFGAQALLKKYWVFHYDLPALSGSQGEREREEIIITKPPEAQSSSENAPYPIDPKSGEPSLCLTTMMGIAFTRKPNHSERTPHVCAAKLLNENCRLDDFPRNICHLTTIRRLEIRSLAFYHELWHVVFPGTSPDAPMLTCKAKLPDSDHGNVEGEAPHFYTWPEDCRAWGYVPDSQAGGFKMSSSVALYDRCTGGKPLQSNHGRLATLAPDNYVWFAHAVWLNANTPYEWSGGLAEEKGVEYMGMEHSTRPVYPPKWLVDESGGDVLQAAE